ncbi:hypothetical protein FisN_4Hh187 [Fistulifera solaris]|uniref:TLC domain-containing protein n=1 Tax=Fistulifera solaris TaxID=1519565 RepID=A0A1Z5K9A5_FISSO|nr:hypothetical protein FisN_4Hh187 [Fistulifera solaris]|eukprot:GAX22701.1 hypothetical protein FisN_4Hh187 [Fistulifera solaris]
MAKTSPRQRLSPTTRTPVNGENDHRPLITKTDAKERMEDSEIEADIARTNHDYFNLVALVPVVLTLLPNWDLSKLFSFTAYPASCYTGEYFFLNWTVTALYFIIDLLWVMKVPTCVKSPDVIIKHHKISLVYLLAPIFFPQYAWFMGAVLSVEINTWFLILRRVIYKNKVHPILAETISFCFYITWIAIRCIVYPFILLDFLRLYVAKVQETETLFHWPMLAIPVHAMLCILNLKWTYDLFAPIVKRWVSSDADSPTIATGL